MYVDYLVCTDVANINLHVVEVEYVYLIEQFYRYGKVMLDVIVVGRAPPHFGQDPSYLVLRIYSTC